VSAEVSVVSGVDAIEVKAIEWIWVCGYWAGARGGSECPAKLFRQRRSQINQLPGDRVAEDQPSRVQEVTSCRQVHQLATSATAISVVTNDRMADRRDVHPDLMRAPGMKVRPQKVDGVEAREPSEICPRRPSCRDDCHALSVSRIAGNWAVDRDPVLGEVTPGQRGIPADDLAGLKGGPERSVSPVTFGHEE
jgi:hypothetical protein